MSLRGVKHAQQRLTPQFFDPQPQVLLITLYKHLGAYGLLSEAFEQLDVKHILWDTLTHLIQPASWKWGALPRVKLTCEYIMRLDRDNRRDTPAFAYEAFEHGTYSKISELIRCVMGWCWQV